eukprot:2088549-Prymnesium_polylepis.1
MVWQLRTKVAVSSMTCKALCGCVLRSSVQILLVRLLMTASSAHIGVMTSLMRNRALTAASWTSRNEEHARKNQGICCTAGRSLVDGLWPMVRRKAVSSATRLCDASSAR